jgi:hypothetical protein
MCKAWCTCRGFGHLHPVLVQARRSALQARRLVCFLTLTWRLCTLRCACMCTPASLLAFLLGWRVVYAAAAVLPGFGPLWYPRSM